MQRSYKLKSSLFTWPGITKDVKACVSTCERCLRFNKRGPWSVPTNKQPVFHLPFECISLDIVGPFRPGTGMKRHVLKSKCRSSGWTDCFPIA